MSLGVIMLVHTALDRAAETARHLAASGCPVVMHADRAVPGLAYRDLQAALSDVEDVRFVEPRRRCEWGTWGIVGATVDAAELMLRTWPSLGHVYLASGSCLPLRPLPELKRYLARHRETDFIESVTIEDVGWSKGGFDRERFTLRFPFAFKKRRRLFDDYVRLQRAVGFSRRIPDGLVPHLGSQWWCLTGKSLSAILSDPRRPDLERYFKRVWIPDESYFQSVVRMHARKVESRSLTLSKFDVEGRPHVFYDDHLQLLRRSDCFMARKIWPQAGKLYASFLTNDPGVTKNADPNPGKIDRLFSLAGERRQHGRPGLVMQSRFPRSRPGAPIAAAPYSVFGGFGDVFDGFSDWLSKTTGLRVHGHLFGPDRVEFAGDDPVYNGGLSDSAALRDYDPDAFLKNLIWATRGERQCFLFGPRDTQAAARMFVADPQAQISVITGAWAIPLFRQGVPPSSVRKEAARLQRIEQAHIALLRSEQVRAKVRIWSLAQFTDSPMEYLQPILDEINPRRQRRLSEAPELADMAGFGGFLQELRNDGMNLHLAGDFPATLQFAPTDTPRKRPYLVK